MLPLGATPSSAGASLCPGSARRGAPRRAAHARSGAGAQRAAMTSSTASPYASRFFAPMPVTPSRSASDRGPVLGERAQRRVAEDDVGRHPELLRDARRATRAAPRRAAGRRHPANRMPRSCGRVPSPPVRPSTSRRSGTGVSPRSTAAAGSPSASVPYSPCGDQDAARQQLADHAAPVLLGEVGAETVRRQRVVALLADAVGRAAAQDVDEVAGAERLAALALQPDDRRQQLLRGDESVPGLGRLEARVAVAARAGCLAEVAEQVLAAASDRLAEREHRVEMLAEALLVGAIAGALVDQPALLHDVAEAVGHPARPRGRRRGRRDRSPGSSPRRTSAGRCARRSARRACRCPCRTRWSRPSRRRRRAGSATGSRRGRRRRARRGTAARRCPACGGTRRSARRTCGSARRRCPPSRAGCERMNASSCRRGSTFGSMRYWMFGRSKLATKCRASGSRSRSVISRCVASRRRRGERDARDAGELRRRGRRARGSRGGSRDPTATRSAPRRSR